MTEVKNNTRTGMGNLRLAALKNADLCSINGDWRCVSGQLDTFLKTVDDFSLAGKYIKEENDKLLEEKKRRMKEIEKEIRDIGYLEQSAIRRDFDAEINGEYLNGLKNICWIAFFRYKMYYDIPEEED